MLVRDKKQVTASWLAGFIEGEGSFNSRKTYSSITVPNSDHELLEACIDYLERNHILFGYSKEQKKTKTGKTMHRITISMDDVYTLYKKLSDVLECRIDEFDQIVGSSSTIRKGAFKIDLEWLIGIWQAEGSFYIRLLRDKLLYPCLEITNTRETIVNKLKHNLLQLGCPHYCQDYRRESRKPSTAIKIYGMLRARKFLTKTENLWFSKRDQLRSSLMLEFINGRLAKNIKEPYSEHEIRIYHRMLDLNI